MDINKSKKKIIELELKLQFHKECVKYDYDFKGYDEYVIFDAVEKLYQKYKDLDIIENPIKEEEYTQYITDDVVSDMAFNLLLCNRKYKPSPKLNKAKKEIEKYMTERDNKK
jgi:hypothetical protein